MATEISYDELLRLCNGFRTQLRIGGGGFSDVFKSEWTNDDVWGIPVPVSALLTRRESQALYAMRLRTLAIRETPIKPTV